MNITLIGGTGFIGSHLILKLIENDDVNLINILSRNPNVELGVVSEKIKIITGDILNSSDLEKSVIEDTTVVNLAYLSNTDESKNTELVSKILDMCKSKKVKRFIHCSTAIVSGRSHDSFLNEKTECNPFNLYERKKLSLEQNIVDYPGDDFEKVILRPTGVFGRKGKNLVKLIDDIVSGNPVVNYLKSSLYGNRTLNLVSVESVVDALVCLTFCTEKIDKEIYIVSEDTVSDNNYISVEKIIRKSLGGTSFLIPRVLIPSFVLSFILKKMGQSNIDLKRRYDSSKLKKLGWKESPDFEEKIISFAQYYKKESSTL